MHALVTGATGHIGYALVLELLAHDYDVKLFVFEHEDVSIFDGMNVTYLYGTITTMKMFSMLSKALTTCFTWRD